MHINDARRAELLKWINQSIPSDFINPDSFQLIAQDASFRRYFRIECHNLHLSTLYAHRNNRNNMILLGSKLPSAPEKTIKSLVIMDAPPGLENCQKFLQTAQLLESSDFKIPTIWLADLEQGFLLLEDFGPTTFLKKIHYLLEKPQKTHGLTKIYSKKTQEDSLDTNMSSIIQLYYSAIDSLIALQKKSQPKILPNYDARLLEEELNLYKDWYLSQHCSLFIDPICQETLTKIFNYLTRKILEQEKVFVHRDFHSRNLMIIGQEVGILDFQDAVYGPITYDLVSLIRDAYVEFSHDTQKHFSEYYWEHACQAGLKVPLKFSDFYQDLDWVSLQRHLKLLGIFSRLSYRDKKPNYMAYIPRVLQYARKVCQEHEVLEVLLNYLSDEDTTHLSKKLTPSSTNT